MKFTVIITLVMIALVGCVGVVSAEVGIVNYDYKTMLSDTTDTYSNKMSHSAVIQPFRFADITDYPDVNSIVVGVKNNYNVYDATDIKSNVECSFTATIGGNVIGEGWYSAYRTCTEKASSKAVITYEFDSWDVSGYSGAKDVYITYSDNDERLFCQFTTIDSYPELPESNGMVRLFNYYEGDIYYAKCGIITVYQKVLFNQKMSYFYEPDERFLDINFNRNGYVNFVNVTNQLDKVLLSSKSGDDMKLHFPNITYVLVTVENPINGKTWINKIPLSIPYDPIMDIMNNSSVELEGGLPESNVNVSAYRASIIALPVIGDLSIGYLDFVDNMHDDGLDMATGIVDTLMYPVDLLNQQLILVVDALQGLLNDMDGQFGILVEPMLKIVTAIPSKVMGVFVFVLALDVVKVLLTWSA